MTGSTSFSFDLDRKIFIRRNRAEFASEPGQTNGQVHTDLMIIYQQPGDEQLRAIYFDNEGHILHTLSHFQSTSHPSSLKVKGTR